MTVAMLGDIHHLLGAADTKQEVIGDQGRVDAGVSLT